MHKQQLIGPELLLPLLALFLLGPSQFVARAEPPVAAPSAGEPLVNRSAPFTYGPPPTHSRGELPQLVAPGVTVGEQLPWRVLASTEHPQYKWARVFAGQLEAGTGEELLAEANWQPQFIRADGSHFASLETPGRRKDGDVVCLWDYNGDGIDDEICHEIYSAPPGDAYLFNPDKALVAYDLAGRKLGAVARGDLTEYPMLCNFNGTGPADLLVDRRNGNAVNDLTWAGYAVGGRAIFSLSAEQGPFYGCVADLTGDGREGLLGWPIASLRPHFYAPHRADSTLPPELEKFGFTLTRMTDSISLDGRTHCLLSSSDGMLFDLRRNVLIALDPAPGYEPAAAHDLDTNGTWLTMGFNNPRVDHPLVGLRTGCGFALAGIIAPHVDREREDNYWITGGQTFAMWDLNGKVTYAENFAQRLDQILTLHAGDGDHVVLVTTSRLLIGPQVR